MFKDISYITYVLQRQHMNIHMSIYIYIDIGMCVSYTYRTSLGDPALPGQSGARDAKAAGHEAPFSLAALRGSVNLNPDNMIYIYIHIYIYIYLSICLSIYLSIYVFLGLYTYSIYVYI